MMGLSFANANINTLANVKAIQRHMKVALRNPPDGAENARTLHLFFQRLEQLDVDRSILKETLIGKTVCKFRKHPEFGSQAKILIHKWKNRADLDLAEAQNRERGQRQSGNDGPPECTGRAAIALCTFRNRKLEIEKEGRKKPDMIAYRELRFKYTPAKQHGELEGVPIGLKLEGRGEAAILGIHGQILSGIDATKDEACYAVCVSGGYADDKDGVNGDSTGGALIYTGSGGRDKHGRQTTDQVENVDNTSLIMSYMQRTPIRLLRGTKSAQGKPVYYYEGLYRCTDYEYESSADGPKVYKFKLEPIEGMSTHSITVHHFEGSQSSSRERIKAATAAAASEFRQKNMERDRQRRDTTRSL